MDLSHQLASGQLLRWPGAASPLVAMMIERLEFEGVYVSGAGLAADLGRADIGITTLDEVVTRSGQIASATELATVVDLDTGFDDPEHAVAELVAHGLAGCHIEDQIESKRCGHLDGKALVSTEQMVGRIAAAVRGRAPGFVIIARTDARAVEGLKSAIDRARAYVDAGADAIFPEALHDRRELERVRNAIDAPLVVNMTEFGKTELLTTDVLHDIGVNAVIYPMTAMRLANRAIEDGLRSLRDHGTQSQLLEHMQTRVELYQLLGYQPD